LSQIVERPVVSIVAVIQEVIEQLKFLDLDTAFKNAGISTSAGSGDEFLYVELFVIKGFNLLDYSTLRLWSISDEQVEVGKVVGVSVLKDIFDLLKLVRPSFEKESNRWVSDRIEQWVSLILLSKTEFLRRAPTHDVTLAEQN